jgi:IS30 family transposase
MRMPSSTAPSLLFGVLVRRLCSAARGGVAGVAVVVFAFAAPVGTVRAIDFEDLSWLQGKEMALHAEITRVLGRLVCFCEKASPWQELDTSVQNPGTEDR